MTNLTDTTTDTAVPEIEITDEIATNDVIETPVENAPTVAEPQTLKAHTLTVVQREVLLLRCAQAVANERQPKLPGGLDLKKFLEVFWNDTSLDFESSNALKRPVDLNRREVSRLIAHFCGIVL